ncbi:MAG: HAD-IIB family hydrolase [Alteromonadaceae bacterium]|nr:HAD-IIB family hydrolase [Alteromonadaceae bacterium]
MEYPQLIIFTDLDGTLLDHDTYSWQAARPALDRIRAAGIPLVLNSSKTAAEIESLRKELDNQEPYIVENSAAVVLPAPWAGADSDKVIHFGASRGVLLSVLQRLREDGASFLGFADMSVEQLVEYTGLAPDMAVRAQQRHGTEPLLWQGSEEELKAFEAALAEENLRLVQGGRFFHVMGQFDKADGARFLLGKYRERFGYKPVSIALGDSPNDQRLLESADIAVVIRGVNSDQVLLSARRHAMRSIKPGPAGWNDCVLNLLFEYGY